MRNIILFWSLLLLPITSVAQNSYQTRMEYRLQTNFGTPTEYISNLYIIEHGSLFTYQDTMSQGVDEFDENKMVFTHYDVDSTLYFVKTDSVILSLDRILGKQKSYCLVTEPLPTIEWVYHDDYRNIDGYDCARATCHFRGRDYEAWYAPEIPIKYGPFKFHGLPGAIFEIKDSTNEVVIRLSRVSFQSGNLPSIDYSLPIVSRDEQQKLKKEHFEKIKRAISSRAGRDFKISVDSFDVKAIELE